MQDTNSIFAISKNTLINLIKGSDHVTIISAYYDLPFLKSIFKERNILHNKQIDMVFSRPAPSAWIMQIPKLQEFQKELCDQGNSRTRIKIAVAGLGPTLHTKLYRFRFGESIQTLVGSANATTNGFTRNDEILINIHGRHVALDNYVKHTVDASTDCKKESSESEPWTSFQSMLRDGFVYFKPNRNVPYELDCFKNKPEVHKALRRAVRTGVGVPHHKVRSVGSLNILSLFKLNMIKDKKQKRVNLHSRAIETAYGYWVPSGYRKDVEDKIDTASRIRAMRLLNYGKKLNKLKSDADVTKIVTVEYLDPINKILEKVQAKLLTRNEKKNITDRVLLRVKRLQEILTSEDRCRYLARTMYGSPVPEIWEDPQSKNEMIESFCEDLASKLQSTSVPKIVKKLRTWFSLESGDEPHDIRQAIDLFLDNNNRKKKLRSESWNLS